MDFGSKDTVHSLTDERAARLLEACLRETAAILRELARLRGRGRLWLVSSTKEDARARQR